MTRIDDVATIVRRAYYEERNEYGGLASEGHIRAARTLRATGHLLPDLPKPDKGDDGSRHWGHGVSWYPNQGLCRWEDGVGGSTTSEALRQEATELLAAAKYSEEHANDQ
ncbi:MAG: hypothetical protein ACI38U_14210 [Corynebacterium sp.]|uniref:hypothetical protein n=1 Tax=Corynebacterium sp. TaxID=1720 RepID=UPI003EFF86F9